MSEHFNPEFLKSKYDLHKTDEVATAAKRTEVRTGEKVSEKPVDRIQNFLNRFTEILERKNPVDKERGIQALKRLLHHKFVMKPEDVPEAAFLLEQRIARELGHGDIEITSEFRERKTKEIIANQKSSLDKWVNYLVKPDADYPDWAKYWAFRSMLEMGKFEKQAVENEETKEVKEVAMYKKRTKDTVSSFPAMNPRALAMTIGVMRRRLDEKAKSKSDRQPVQNTSSKLDDAAFQALLSTENFSKIYTQFLIEMPEYSTEGLQETRGRWVTYQQDTEGTGEAAKRLVDSLEGHPLEWCTADLDTAKTQLQGGDFHTYYSFDQEGQPTVPRIAIRMQEGKIAEVRGIAPDQNIDPYIAPIVNEKMKEFPDGEEYQKKASDMKRLTEIEKKLKDDEDYTIDDPRFLKSLLNKGDLRFLYEVDGPIEGFGYEKDPRIAELLSKRNPEMDVTWVFDCDERQIARSLDEIAEDTKVYVGPLEPGIFDRLPETLEYIFTSFPEGRVHRERIEIGGKTKEELEMLLEQQGFEIDGQARFMMKGKDFTTAKEVEEAKLIRLSVDALGFPNGATTKEIFESAEAFGLELCPAEVGPQYRLQYTNQPMNEWIYIGMTTISGADGRPDLFSVGRDGDGSWLGNFWSKPDFRWPPGSGFVFRHRKKPLTT